MHPFQLIKNMELELVKPQTRSNTARLDELIADDFKEIGSSGNNYNKADILRYLPNENIHYELSNFVFNRISHIEIDVEYRSLSEGKMATRRSKWIYRQGQWKLLHHQAVLSTQAS